MLPLYRKMAGEFLYVHLFVLPDLSWAGALTAGTQLLPENAGRFSTPSGWVAGNKDGNQERWHPSSFACSHLLRSACEHQGSACGMSTRTGGQGSLVSHVWSLGLCFCLSPLPPHSDAYTHTLSDGLKDWLHLTNTTVKKPESTSGLPSFWLLSYTAAVKMDIMADVMLDSQQFSHQWSMYVRDNTKLVWLW